MLHIGGEADTVVKGKGAGFTFIDYDPDALWKAVQCFEDQELWRELVQQAMAQDFSWSRSAGEYFKLYRRLKKRG